MRMHSSFKFAWITIVFLVFLIGGKSAFATEKIVNGGFEDGAGWTNWTRLANGANQTDSWWNVLNSNVPSGFSTAHTGTRHQYLGADIDAKLIASNVDGILYQTLTIPAGTSSAIFSYYLRISTNEYPNGVYDKFYVYIENSIGQTIFTIGPYSNLDSSSFSSWTYQSVDLGTYVNLSSLAGQQIRVVFRGVTDNTVMTVFHLDDVSLQVTTSQISQTINFTNPGTKTLGTGPYSLTASGGASGNPVTFATLTSNVCTVSGNTVALVSAGTCTIAANQAGNASYAAAAQVTQSFTVTTSQLPDLWISFFYVDVVQQYYPLQPQISVDNSSSTMTAGASTLKIYLSTDAMTISSFIEIKTLNYPILQPLQGQAYISLPTIPNTTPPGSYYACAIADVFDAVRESNEFNNIKCTNIPVVTILSQTINFTNPGTRPLGSAPFTLIANGGLSGNPVTFTTLTPTICTVSGSTVALVAAGTCRIAANQADNWATSTVGYGTYAAAAQVTQSFTVSALNQTINFTNPGTKTLGTGPFSLTASGGASGNPVTFATLTSNVCTVSGNTVALVSAGTCTIAANQAGNASYTAAAQVTRSFTVAPGIPAVSLSLTSLTFIDQIVGTTSPWQNIVLTNTGTGTLSVTSVISSVSAFSITHSCVDSLRIGEICFITVDFTPTAIGTRVGSITIASNAAGSPHSVTVSGVGVPSNAPSCTLSAAPATVRKNGPSTLTASCSPVATSFTWTGGTCAGKTSSICTVTPGVTTNYSVTGTNNFGNSTPASATITVRSADLTPILMLLLD